MKTSTIPPIRVEPEFRREVEGVLEQGESISQFVENAVRETVLKRKHQAEFVRRGMVAIAHTRHNGEGVPADDVIARLESRLAAAVGSQAQRGR